MATESASRSRSALVLAVGQIRYQILVLLRSPLGFFVSVVIPLILLICLKALLPGEPVGALPYAQWLTPAMCAFCLLNACYVASVTGIVLAREEGILKRLRGTPLPAWAYLAGRFGSAFVTAAAACAVIIATGVLFFHVRMVWHAFGYFLTAALMGIVCFFVLGAAVTVLVPRSETALPVAFGSMLPLAFISNVFFAADPPQWLHDLAYAFPVAPVATAMEDSFDPATHSWPMPVSGTLVVLGWVVAAIIVMALAFRWEPGPARAALTINSPRRWRRPGHRGNRPDDEGRRHTGRTGRRRS
ncbi:ABC transporter permease [Actinoplanes sp. NPDC049316]|uniref:ABC transporter permease n=1 Tax=Actinoplanes sp. NPDC049316 TaxID=3154727 RepID=UPI00342FFF81